MSSRNGARRGPAQLRPFTIPHFARYAALMVWDDGEQRELEDWQLEMVGDLFSGFKRNLWILPEENGKSTLVSLVSLYGADYSPEPWIPVCASAARQARIIHDQATGFIRRTPGMLERFYPLDGRLVIRSRTNGGKGIEIFAYDRDRADGIIPFPFAINDEMHAMPDIDVWELWGRKLRKRGAQLLGITTGGEPETPFENMRDAVRRRAKERKREGSHLRAVGNGEVLHEWMVPKDELCSDMEAVKAANPLGRITAETLQEDFDLITDLGDWKRCKCNRPTRSTQSAVSDKEWDDAEISESIPAGVQIDVGFDVAWKWDTASMVALWQDESAQRVLGEVKIIVPPRDGTSIHPDEMKFALNEYAHTFKLNTVIMDMSRADDIAHWIEDELGVEVIDRGNSNAAAVEDFDNFMEALRNGTLKHTGDPGLRAHVLNAIARRLPGGDHRFDRPHESRRNKGAQDRRVIDALTAAGMVNTLAEAPPKPKPAMAFA